MVGQALFYEQATALSAQRHGDWCIDQGGRFAYARNTNSVPLMAVEFQRTVAQCPVVFVNAGDGAVLPVAVLGLQVRQNVFIGSDGNWTGKYIPAFVRRYPFIFAADDEQKRFTLCVDESYGGFNQEGRGERLFDSEGKPTEFLSRMLGFLSEYQSQHQRTLEFTRALTEHGLFEEMRADVSSRAGAKASLTGFLTINRERLMALEDSVLGAMVRNGHMELICLHWQSMGRFSELAELAAGEEPADEGGG